MRRPGLRGLIAVALIVVGLAAVGVWVWVRSSGLPPSDDPTPAFVVVEPGVTARTLGRRLEEAGVIRSRLAFEARLRARNATGLLQAGTYEIPRNRALDEVIDMLVSGRVVLVPVTVPEGLRIELAAGVVARELGLDSLEVLEAATDSLLADSFGIPAPTLEGYLFPETYRVDPGTDARGIVRLMARQFDEVFTPSWRARSDSLGRSVHEIVTLASIVEKEAQRADERTVIAGVFWNRLRRGMRLEADPTVQYALGGHRTRVLYRDLEVESAYNTYRNDGLPPGPIASPGRASLEATLYPDSVPYLYFFATGDGGRHTFSETFTEHNRKRRELGR